MLGPYIIERALENGNCWLANYSDEKPMVSINGKSLKRCGAITEGRDTNSPQSQRTSWVVIPKASQVQGGVRETSILSPPSDEATSLRLNSQISSKMAVPSDWQTMQMQPAKKTGYGSGRIPILRLFFENRGDF
jgi:hypothetical protein